MGRGEEMNKYFVLTVASIWFASALAISVSLYFTRDMRSLWFLLVPLLTGVRVEKEKTNEENE